MRGKYMKKTTKYSDSYFHYKQLLLIQEPRAACTKHPAKKATKYWCQILTAENYICVGTYNLSPFSKTQNKDPSILTQT